MFKQFTFPILALLGGALLSMMIFINSLLASQTTSLSASWIAHGVGGVMAALLIPMMNRFSQAREYAKPTTRSLFFFGGIPGALTVVLASITVNSEIGLTGTLALGLVGQLLSSIICEHWALFGLAEKRLSPSEWLPILLVAAGATLIIFSR